MAALHGASAKNIFVQVGGNTTSNSTMVFQPAQIIASLNDIVVFNCEALPGLLTCPLLTSVQSRRGIIPSPNLPSPSHAGLSMTRTSQSMVSIRVSETLSTVQRSPFNPSQSLRTYKTKLFGSMTPTHVHKVVLGASISTIVRQRP